MYIGLVTTKQLTGPVRYQKAPGPLRGGGEELTPVGPPVHVRT